MDVNGKLGLKMDENKKLLDPYLHINPQSMDQEADKEIS